MSGFTNGIDGRYQYVSCGTNEEHLMWKYDKIWDCYSTTIGSGWQPVLTEVPAFILLRFKLGI